MSNSLERHLHKSQKGGGLGNVLASSQHNYQVVKSVVAEKPTVVKKQRSTRRIKKLKPQLGGKKVVKRRRKLQSHKNKKTTNKKISPKNKLRRLYATRHAIF